MEVQVFVVNDDVRYEDKSVKAIRGTVGRTIAKWQSEGWELVSQDPGALRTELTFRRVKPRASRRRIAVLVGGLAAVGLISGIGAATEANDTAPTASSASTTTAPAEPAPSQANAAPAEDTVSPAEGEAQEEAEKKAAEDKARAAAKVKQKAAAQEKARKAAAQKVAKQKAKEKAQEKRRAAEAEADAKLTFSNSADMNQTYPHGVGKPGARDDSRGRPITTFKVSSHIYSLNAGSDRDEDGIACERR